jgi:hypothetical protein
MPCYLCNAIPQNVPGANAGDHLVQSGPAELNVHEGLERVAITYYKCSECGSRWRYVDDPANPSAGWQFVQRAR